jgi:hypothetical protein
MAARIDCVVARPYAAAMSAGDKIGFLGSAWMMDSVVAFMG